MSQVTTGAVPMSVKMALKIEAVTGLSANILMSLEVNHQRRMNNIPASTLREIERQEL
jgi:plasmid maintenance system antidote protein VapI